MSAVYDWWFHASSFAWTLRLYTASAVGQTLFVAVWATLPWWRTPVGRALMWKSAALMIVLDWALVVFHFGPFRHQVQIGLWLFGLVALGIWFQLGAIAREVWLGRRERRAAREPDLPPTHSL